MNASEVRRDELATWQQTLADQIAQWEADGRPALHLGRAVTVIHATKSRQRRRSGDGDPSFPSGGRKLIEKP